MSVLRGKVALVTGASKGIGRGLALALAEAGSPVVLTARDRAELDAVAGEIRGRGGQATCIQAELRDPSALGELAARAREAMGRVDILVNNAAAPGPVGRFLDLDVEAWVDTQILNVFAPARLTRLLAPDMLERGWGRILNISSGAARARVGEAQNAYGASKAALETHTLKLALELEGSGVTANVLRPGATDTPMQTHMRNQDPAQAGPSVEVFRTMYASGLIKPVEVPVREALGMLEGAGNGLIVEMRRQKDSAGRIEDVVEALPHLS